MVPASGAVGETGNQASEVPAQELAQDKWWQLPGHIRSVPSPKGRAACQIIGNGVTAYSGAIRLWQRGWGTQGKQQVVQPGADREAAQRRCHWTAK